MSTTPLPRVLLLGDEPFSISVPRLEAAGFSVVGSRTRGINLEEVAAARAVVFDVQPAGVRPNQSLCRRWRIELGEAHVPIVWLATDFTPLEVEESLDAGVDVILPTPVTPGHLAAQLRSLMRVQHLNQRLVSRAGEVGQVNQRLQLAYQQMDQSLELTRRIHRNFLPTSVPAIGPLRFAIDYRARSRVGGDFFDIMRLDENHVAIYLADAMGSGPPASSLLSIFVKRALRPKLIEGNTYRILPPDETLSRLNRELLGLGLSEPPFVTMSWLTIDTRDGSVAFARAAHPHPLHIPKRGEVEYWHSPGTLLGVFEADFPAQAKRLLPGDKILLFSDGVNPTDADPLRDAALNGRDLPIDAFVERLSKETLPYSRPDEDFTLIGVEFGG